MLWRCFLECWIPDTFLWLCEILYLEHWTSRNTASLRPAGKRDTVLKRTWWVCYWEWWIGCFYASCWYPHPLLTTAVRLRFKGSERLKGIAWWSLWHCDSHVCSSQSYDLLVKCARDTIEFDGGLLWFSRQPKHCSWSYWHLSQYEMVVVIAITCKRCLQCVSHAVPLLHWRSVHLLLFLVAQFFELPN